MSNELQDPKNYIFKEEKKKKEIVSKNIINYTNKFPPLIYYQEKQGIKLLKLKNKFNLPLKL